MENHHLVSAPGDGLVMISASRQAPCERNHSVTQHGGPRNESLGSLYRYVRAKSQLLCYKSMGLKWVGIALHDGDARTADGEILHFTLHPLLFSSMTLICISGCISAILISALSPIIESSVPAQRESRSPPPFTLHAL